MGFICRESWNEFWSLGRRGLFTRSRGIGPRLGFSLVVFSNKG